MPRDFKGDVTQTNRMSIELTGPQKYKFQDHVCVLLAILSATDADASLQIEPQDGEDALITLDQGGKPHVIEVQVKGAQGAINADDLANWLAHFPSHKAKNSLIERLVADPFSSVLFVASGRCDDATVAQVTTLSAHSVSLADGTISKNAESGIRAALERYARAVLPTDKDLAKERRAHIGSQLPRITATKLRGVLHRVMISERLDDAEIMRRCRDSLLSRYRVVPDRVEDVLAEIESIVFREKRTHENVLTKVAKAIAAGQAKDPLVAATYVTRGEEATLLRHLSHQHAVLITGAPRVGKSFCARSLASQLQAQGYIVRVCGDLAEADRFLCEPVSGLRAALVDDPLGGAHASENAERELQLLERLIPRLINGRRLIVAQAQDRLLEVTRLNSLAAVMTAGRPWTAMGIGSVEFLELVWKNAATAYAVSADRMQQIAIEIMSSRLDLEPGCLVYLAANLSRLDDGATIEDIVRFARQDSKTLGGALRKEQSASLLNSLAVATTPELHVAELELAFILDSKRDDRPGESNVIGIMSSIGAGPPAKASPPPSYAPPLELPQDAIDSLEHLELRRMVTARERRYTFSHPFSRAAAESLLDAATNRSTAEALALLRRALFTIAPDTAKAAATNLGWLYRNLNSSDGQQGVIDAAKSGLRSIFPVVRDICFQFLTRRLPSLPSEQQLEISTWVRSVTSTELTYLEWVDNQPRIPAATVAGALEVDMFTPAIPKQDVEGTLALLDSDRPDFIPHEIAVKALMYLEDSPDEMTAQMAARLLSYDVSLIRALAAKTWLTRPRTDDAWIVERIFNEQHPAIAESVYLGIIDVWPFCDDERRALLMSSLRTMAASPIAAITLIGHLVLIARKEHGGETTPWTLFEGVMPVVMGALPPGVALRDERLYHVMDSAIGKISMLAMLEIVDRWIDLVEELASREVPSDYMLGVTSILVEGVPADLEGREDRIDRLLGLPGTASRIRVVADLVDSWDQLSEVERSLLLAHLTTGSPDEVWVQAAALTRSDVSSEIQRNVLPTGINLSDTPEAVISNIPAQLFNACVEVFTGNHPNIFYVGVHGATRSVWHAIVREVLRVPNHPMFEACWNWMALTNETAVLAEVASELGTEHSERLADLLFERKQRTNGEFMPEVWEALFGLPLGDDVKSNWIERMAAIAPEVLNSLGEYTDWVPRSHQKEFLSHFDRDVSVRKLFIPLREMLDDIPDSTRIPVELADNLLMLARKVIVEAPPKHWSTCEAMLKTLRLFGAHDEQLTKDINQKRIDAIDLRKNRPQPVVHKLEYWVELP